MKFLVAASLLSSLIGVNGVPVVNEKRQSSGLNWAPCDLDFGSLNAAVRSPIDCSTLAVPLDYTDDNSETLQLQLVKLNATKAPYKGSILINPGGPGASGVTHVATSGPIYSRILDGHYDIIGFDPRGTGKTIPFACNLTGQLMNPTDGLKKRELLLVQQNLTDRFLNEGWQDSKQIADACSDTESETGAFLSTAFVARDMREIIDALGEDKLQYWGTSYGTVLGATFAAMFPDRVGRVLLDSVVNSHEYMAGTRLQDSADVDAAMYGFFQQCIAAPSICPLSSYNGQPTTPEFLVAAVNEVLQELIDDPIYLPDSARRQSWDKNDPVTLYEVIKGYFFQILYTPTQFRVASFQLAQILTRNYDAILNDTSSSPPEEEWNEGVDAIWGISCSDTNFRQSSPEEMLGLVEQQSTVSSMADIYFPQTWPCARWNIDAAERYSGDFQVKTDFPILFTNSPYDPITPIRSAFNMSSGFEDSVVLQHNGHSHGFYGHPSTCVGLAVRAYFNDGVLPEEGTVCEPNENAFAVTTSDIRNFTLTTRSAESEDDRALLAAMYELAEHEATRRSRSSRRFRF